VGRHGGIQRENKSRIAVRYESESRLSGEAKPGIKKAGGNYEKQIHRANHLREYQKNYPLVGKCFGKSRPQKEKHASPILKERRNLKKERLM